MIFEAIRFDDIGLKDIAITHTQQSKINKKFQIKKDHFNMAMNQVHETSPSRYLL